MASNTLDSLDRGLAVAELIASRHRVSQVEVSEWLSVSKATAYRILVTLESRGWVARDAGNTGYRMGPVLMHLIGIDPLERIRVAAELPLTELARVTGETANLAALVGNNLVYEKVIDGSHSLRMYAEIGTVAPFHATGLGRAFLAACDQERALQFVGNGPFLPTTAKSLTGKAEILRSVDEARAIGYAVEKGEAEDGATCIAVAVLDQDGNPVGAVSISGPDTRYSPDQIFELAKSVSHAAAEITRQIRTPEAAIASS